MSQWKNNYRLKVETFHIETRRNFRWFNFMVKRVDKQLVVDNFHMICALKILLLQQSSF